METKVTRTPEQIALAMIDRLLSFNPWRVRRARDRRLRAVAEEWKKRGGYFIATPQELAEKYPEFFRCATNEPQDRIIWSISVGLRLPGGYYKPAICPVTNLSK